jgi:hypothetical protein
MLARAARFRSLLLCVVLEVGVFCGVPMRPDEIEKLMRSLSSPAVAQTLPTAPETGDGDDPEQG